VDGINCKSLFGVKLQLPQKMKIDVFDWTKQLRQISIAQFGWII